MDQEQEIMRITDRQFVAYLAVSILFTLSYYEAVWLAGANQFVKGLVGGLMILSESLLIILSVKSFRLNKSDIGFGFKMLMFLILVYNLVHIVYAAVWDTDVAYFTFFGNPEFQPVFMLPLVTFLGLNAEYFFPLFKGIGIYIWIACVLCLLRLHVNQFEGVLLLFIISFAAYMPSKKRVTLFLVAIIYMVFCYIEDDRMAIIRTIVGFTVWLVSYLPLYRYLKILKVIFLTSIVVPFYFITLFARTGYSVFEEPETATRISRLGADNTGDTRTFLYEELFEDLSENDAWLLGKGLNGTYYSSYFDRKNVDADIADRKGVEVGVLNYLLKGGIVQSILYLLLLVWSSYSCLFQSNSKAMMLVGFILLAHYIFLFVEEVPRYDIYNITIWFYIGLGFSNTLLEREEDYFEERISEIVK